jgi:thiosulfate/3-mercaptopyruvate sulfurtransferase
MSREHVLVTPDWVVENLGMPGIVLVEVDENADAYRQTHIEGAVGLDWRADLQHPRRRDFIGKRAFEQLLSACGIGNDDTVVLYGGNNNWFAAYAYWYFKVYGHADVRLLDGGRKRWELEGRPLVSGPVHRPGTEYKARDADPSLRAYRDDILAALGTATNIVDVRSPASSPARSSPRQRSRRSSHTSPGMFPAPPTSRGRRLQPMTGRSRPTRNCVPSTPMPE